MKFWGIVRFELAYQIRRPWPWLMFAFMLVLTFLATRDDAVQRALYDEYFANSPFQIVVSTVVGVLMWLLVAPVIAGEAAARDVATGMYPLVYTAPLTKAHYLGGRFLAALILNAVLLLAVQIGALMAVYSPGVNAELIGPFRPIAYLTAYAYVAVPTAIVATAVQFALALRSGRPMAGYLGSLILGFMGFFVASLLLFRRGLGTLLDPIGIRYVIEDIAHLWTTAEKNTRLLAFEGVVLQNRLVWLGIALGVIALTYLRFRFAHRSETGLWSALASGAGMRALHSRPSSQSRRRRYPHRMPRALSALHFTLGSRSPSVGTRFACSRRAGRESSFSGSFRSSRFWWCWTRCSPAAQRCCPRPDRSSRS